MFKPDTPFDLQELPPPLRIQERQDLTEFLERHNDALQAVANLNGALEEVRRPEIFLSTFYLQESISSNAVEDIHTTMQSALEDETKPESEQSEENKEVMNYRSAMAAGMSSLEKFGLGSRTIRAVHKELKVKRGIPGEFRRGQNSIATIERNGVRKVIYTPPIAAKVDPLIGNWESFVSKEKKFFPLVKAAMAHYQFEAIHPFEDGNGRTGRILMVLQLIQDGILSHPAFFISAYLSENDDLYKELLLKVSQRGEWWNFVDFMLIGFETQALKTRIALVRLRKARRELRELLYSREKKTIRESWVATVVDHIFQFPTTHAKFMEKETGIHWQTCSKYLKTLEGEKVLTHHQRGRYKFFHNKKALNALVVK